MRGVAFTALAFLIVATAIAFYWYEYRPSHVRELCETEAIDNTRQIVERFAKAVGSESPEAMEGIYFVDLKDRFYVTCMRQHGVAY